MDRMEQIIRLHRLLKGKRRAVPRQQLEQEFGISRASLTRLIAFCRDRIHMPIHFNRDLGGYVYEEAQRDSFELPGLWFSANELRALMVSHRLLGEIEPGVLRELVNPLQQRLESLLEHGHAGSREVWQRVRILPIANRTSRLEDFQLVADALITRKRLRVVYSGRGRGEVNERWLSPQRLIYYRDNWYLDAWCHLRQDLRTFSLDRLRVLETGNKARDIPDSKLDAHVSKSYGIFAGKPKGRAVIHFSADAARWVADEEWHPEQQSRHLEDGRWELVVPYGDPTELIRDILRFGPEAEVVGPESLREVVRDRLSRALRQYRKLHGVPGKAR